MTRKKSIDNSEDVDNAEIDNDRKLIIRSGSIACKNR